MRCNVTVKCNGAVTVLAAETGDTLISVLERNSQPISAPCGGKGKCGKCRVKARGGVKTDSEGYCLACKTVIDGDCEVILEQCASRVLSGGIETNCTTDGESGFGLAVDIGTTTVAAYIVDLSTAEVISTKTMLNPQRSHGADVISRLQYASQSRQNADILKNEIAAMLEGFIADSAEPVKKCVLVGNTVMMHLAAGYDSAPLARAPFTPQYRESHSIDCAGVDTLLGGVVSGYVGADTIAAALACGMDKANETELLIDIGTNGEILLHNNGKYVCCSCAAGPAFEGAHITCGTGAIAGAIDHVYGKTDGGFEVTTIENADPVGICGSGLVDAVAYLVANESVTPVGRMNERFILSHNIAIEPADIREVQLAKAAISAGISILSDRLGIDISDIQRVHLAGGFGNYIDIHNACEIGLLPIQLEERITAVGNAAGSGARMLLVSEDARARYEALRGKTEYIELSDQADFEDYFADALIFGDDD